MKNETFGTPDFSVLTWIKAFWPCRDVSQAFIRYEAHLSICHETNPFSIFTFLGPVIVALASGERRPKLLVGIILYTIFDTYIGDKFQKLFCFKNIPIDCELQNEQQDRIIAKEQNPLILDLGYI